MYLNLIDPPLPLFKPQSFDLFLTFARRVWSDGARLLIHCNKGESRAPALAMLFLAKQRLISNDSFDAAFKEFFPTFTPGRGIHTYLTEHWAEIR